MLISILTISYHKYQVAKQTGGGTSALRVIINVSEVSTQLQHELFWTDFLQLLQLAILQFYCKDHCVSFRT